MVKVKVKVKVMVKARGRGRQAIAAAGGPVVKQWWEDGVLTDVAANLIVGGSVEAGETLLLSSEITLRYGDSWWDGHDDYIYDVHVTITTDPAGVPALAALGQRLPAAFGDAVHTFVDAAAELRRGSLEGFDAQVDEVTISPERSAQRSEDTATMVRAIRSSRG